MPLPNGLSRLNPFGTAPVPGSPGAAELRSAAEFEEAIRAEKGGVVVLFDAAWCAPGRRLWASLNALAERGTMVPLRRLDVDLAPGIAARYGVAGLPTLVFFHGGQVAASRLGEVTPDALERWIDDLERA
jgi:thioredoxin 1